MEALSAMQQLVLSQQESTKCLEQNMSNLTKDLFKCKKNLSPAQQLQLGKVQTPAASRYHLSSL